MDATKLIEEAEAMAARTLDPPLPPAVEALLTDLATALSVSEERVRQQELWAENVAAVAEQTNVVARDCLQERDAALKRLQACERERNDLAARLQSAQSAVASLRDERARLTTPRPIAEAPRDGTWVLGIWEKGPLWEENPKMAEAVAWEGDDSGCWLDESGNTSDPTHYLPLPEVKP